MNILKEDFLSCFPYPQIRTHQLETLEKLYNNWDNYDNFIIEAPTGTGKSAIAYTLCNALKNGLILTSTKLLQDQYVKEFKEMFCLKGKSSYKCNYNPVMNCNNAICQRSLSFKKNNYPECKECAYQQALRSAELASITLSNYSSFIYNPVLKKRNYNVCILDEAHKLEETLVQVRSFTVDKAKWIQKYHLEDEIEKLEDTLVASMIMTGLSFKETDKTYVYKGKEMPHNVMILSVIYDLLQFRRDVLCMQKQIELDDKEAKEFEHINDLIVKLAQYLTHYDDPNWIVDIKNKDTIVIQPLNIEDLFDKLTKKCDKKIFMSATIISVGQFVKIFGLDPRRTAYISVPETFNPLYAPIVSEPTGPMGYRYIQQTIPAIVEKIRYLLKVHENEKGIILTNNYEITQAIIKQIKSKRLIHKFEKEYYHLSNEEMYLKHIQSVKPTVLISPSMNTGVDLPDEQSRFQIIVKMPWDALSDKRIAFKKRIDPDWYNTQMVRTFVQSCGRSVRNDKDWCVTYVLDDDFLKYISKAKSENKVSDIFYSRCKYNCEFDLKEFKKFVGEELNKTLI